LRVAALYDVHGMPWPLEAVLAEVADGGVDEVVFGGDFICGPYPRRTLELVRSVEGARLIRGNCERDPGEEERSELAGEVDDLLELPMTVSFDGVLYCHSTPTDDQPIISAATPLEEVESLFDGIDERTVVIGHTHHQFELRGRVRVINAGSIGMPYEGEVAAFWTLIDEGEPEFRKTPFDVERAIAEIEASSWPPGPEFVAENLRAAVAREEAIAWYESRRV
jgi:predicted phosphodiesterase